MKRTLFCSVAAAAVGLAVNASAGTINLTDEFGNRVQGATVAVTPAQSANPGFSATPTVGDLRQTANELIKGGYAVTATGPMLVEVTHPAYGTVHGKLNLGANDTVDMVLGVGAAGPELRRAGQESSAKSAQRSRNAAGGEDVGGDTCTAPTVIPWSSIIAAGGYTDSGTTGTVSNTTPACGANGSDVHYAFTAATAENLCLTTCLNGDPTDTVLQVWNGVCASNVACNDDSCSVPPGGNTFNSTLSSVPVAAGSNYSISIDNWASLGNAPYNLNVGLCPTVDCPPDGVLEGEPNCGGTLPPGCAFNDTTNGGCNSNPPVFSDVACGDTICGTYGNCNGALRDTDWYQLVVPVGNVYEAEWCCIGEHATLNGLVNNTNGSGNCAQAPGNFQVFSLHPAFTEGCATALIGPGTWWYFTATSDFTGAPCGTAYTCTLGCTDLCAGGPGGGGGSQGGSSFQ